MEHDSTFGPPRASQGRKLSILGVNQKISFPKRKSVITVPVFTRFKEPGDAIKLFRKCSKTVMHCLFWFRLLDHIKTGGSVSPSATYSKTFMELLVELQAEMSHTTKEKEPETASETESEDSLFFDKSHFKARQDIVIPEEIRKLLTLRPAVRSKDVCNKVLPSLQPLRSFADYSLKMQENLCRVAWYQRIAARKVIIRQGHPAENFYFVISGQALVKISLNDETGKVYNKTIARLQRDDCFGETGLLRQSHRTVTVESASDMEVLTITREDYLRIFTKAHGPSQEPEHISFCRKLAFLEHWPLDTVVADMEQCMTSYFRAHSLVFSDSEDTDYIYIIKSGHVQILKKLYKPDSQIPFFLESFISHIAQENQNGGGAEDFRSAPRCTIMETPFPRLMSRGDTGTRSRIAIDPELYARMVTPVPANARQHSSADTSKDDSNSRDMTSSMSVKTNPEMKREITAISREITNFGKISEINSEGKTPVVESHIELNNEPEYVMKEYTFLTQNEDIDEGDITKYVFFVELGELHSGDVFGLHSLHLEDDVPAEASEHPSLSMVSKGAEIIMLSKKFFLKNSTEKVRRYIRENVRPYPLEWSMQEKLKEKAAWKQYKKTVLDDCLLYQQKVKDSK